VELIRRPLSQVYLDPVFESSLTPRRAWGRPVASTPRVLFDDRSVIRGNAADANPVDVSASLAAGCARGSAACEPDGWLSSSLRSRRQVLAGEPARARITDSDRADAGEVGQSDRRGPHRLPRPRMARYVIPGGQGAGAGVACSASHSPIVTPVLVGAEQPRLSMARSVTSSSDSRRGPLSDGVSRCSVLLVKPGGCRASRPAGASRSGFLPRMELCPAARSSRRPGRPWLDHRWIHRRSSGWPSDLSEPTGSVRLVGDRLRGPRCST
jgi:hypothetical protein